MRCARIVALTLFTLVAAEMAFAADAPMPQKVMLWPEAAPIADDHTEESTASITVYLPASDKVNGAAAVICPGGGYGGLAINPEGHGIAKWLNMHGIAGAVLEYRLPKGRSFVPLHDAQRALRIVRSRAAEWKIDPTKIGIVGFSAGGHLASTAATHFDVGKVHAADAVEQASSRPDFAILIYPVISMGEKTHGGSRKNLLGADPKPELVKLFSNELQVTDQTPPVFFAHAKDDRVVVPENSQMMHDALVKAKVPTEYLELPSGGHGLNGYKGPNWDAWQTKSLEWLTKIGITK